MKTKYLSSTVIFFTLIFYFGFQSVAQNDDGWATKKYEFGEFKKIYLEGSYKVYLIQGKEPGVVVKTSDGEMLSNLSVKYFGDRLSFRMNRAFYAYKRMHLYITFNNLEEVSVAGGVRMHSEGYIDVNELDVRVQGGAKVGLKLKAEDLKVVGEGGVWIDLEGVTRNLDVRLSGAGNLNAHKLKADDVEFRIEGVGNGKVHAEKTLHAKIEGVGKIKYSGNPKVTRNVEGIGSVEPE